ncbi:MAG: hypothetical protein J2P28_01835 [Actinobacteria bacterium]|nr:hypothetical protein [Actinomycetota bacterium]MBO0834242.1 hypothetical protein [Actinomycetota bacterium]
MVAVLSVLAAVPVAALLALYQRWWATRSPGRLLLSWRKIAFLWCMSADALLFTVADQLPYGRRAYYFDAQWVLIAAAVVFFLMDARRQRLTRRDPRV